MAAAAVAIARGGQAIAHRGAGAARFDQPGGTQYLKVLQGIGERLGRLSRQFLHPALALGEDIQEFEPVSIGQRLADASELLVQLVLEGTFGLLVHGLSSINQRNK
jgi:hypothetical protein